LCIVAKRHKKGVDYTTILDLVASSPNKYIPGQTLVFHFKSETSLEPTGNVLVDRIMSAGLLPKPVEQIIRENTKISDFFIPSSSSSHATRQDWEPPLSFIPDNATLSDLSMVFGSDKGPLKHNYTQKYEHYLAELKNAEFNLLEIGVANGSSLKMWATYFKYAYIYGFDIDERCNKLCQEWKRINIYTGECPTAELNATWDVIIDDSSHISRDIVDNFTSLWSKLKPGGYYFVEDTKCTFTLSQMKYNPSRNLFDYRRSIFLEWLNKILADLDVHQGESMFEYVHIFPELVVIKKNASCMRSELCPVPRQYKPQAMALKLLASANKIIKATYLLARRVARNKHYSSEDI
jgi:hypothetical protein